MKKMSDKQKILGYPYPYTYMDQLTPEMACNNRKYAVS